MNYQEIIKEGSKILKLNNIKSFNLDSEILLSSILKLDRPKLILNLSNKIKDKDKKNYFNLSKKSDLKEAASNLYKTLRKIKKLKFKKIYVVKIPNKSVGIAINDRLKKAAN